VSGNQVATLTCLAPPGHWLEWSTNPPTPIDTVNNNSARNGTSRGGMCSSHIENIWHWYRHQPVGVILADGHAICPECRTRVNCGTVGIANLEQRHRGKKICWETRERRDKEMLIVLGSLRGVSFLTSSWKDSSQELWTAITMKNLMQEMQT